MNTKTTIETITADLAAIETITADLDAIGSEYNGCTGWVHAHPVQGRRLVAELVRINKAIGAKLTKRHPAWGQRSGAGTIICGCGRRGQERGTVCDQCGQAL